ncbi:hypothetical protein CERSUDRAFT_111733 [Gelatoporia subvermispora B]|uniref:DUF967 domain protein n=1 Tax=Ceriporiopsis subvermispora (strain B) TaxID=914234 RepID=M2R9S9_CERS8|nr:hypothetical protein CERSUDRAFT_111733 [Gelatoporia subvermispora B]
MSNAGIRNAPETLEAVVEQEQRCVFPFFTAETAWTLGSLLRTRLREASPRPAVVNITLANTNQLLFHCASRPGTQADNDIWVARKRATVLRWGASTLQQNYKMGSGTIAEKEQVFAAKFQLGARASEYAIHGGGFPIRVKGVEGIVGVIVVSGLTMQEDHEVIVEVIEEYLRKVESGEIKE